MKSYDTDTFFDALNRLPVDIARKLYRKGLQKGALVVKHDIQRRLWPHKRSGTLEKSIITKRRIYSNAAVAIIGVQSHFSQTYRGRRVVAHKIAHFVTNLRRRFKQEYPKASGRYRWIGANTPDNFIEKAEQSAGPQAVARMVEVINDGIQAFG